MNARLTQTSVKPGATLRLNAILTEYGQPVERRARRSRRSKTGRRHLYGPAK